MPASIAQIIANLTSPESARRAGAAERLSRLGPEAHSAAVQLARASADESEDVREWVTSALEDLGPPPVSDALLLASLLDDPSADVGYWAATLLGRLGADADSAVTALASAVAGSADMSVRGHRAWALGKIGPPAAAALDVLRNAASGSDPRLARLAQRALSQIDG